MCRKGDYFRYMAEFGSDAERKENADNSLDAYKVFFQSCLPSTLIFYFPLFSSKY